MKYTFAQLLTEGVYDKGIFKAVFLFGGSGSGKSYIYNKHLKGLGLKVVNSDNAFELTLKKKNIDAKKLADVPKDERDDWYLRAKVTANMQMDAYIDSRLGLLIDGTGKDLPSVKNLVNLLEGLGYDCIGILISTSLKTALKRNRQRSRVLPDEIVQNIHKQVKSNSDKFVSIFKAGFYEINNDDGSTIADDINLRQKINAFINKKPNNKIAINWIETELKNKKRI